MSREQLETMAVRALSHHEAGTQDQEPGVLRVPTAAYYDPQRWQAEMDAIFHRVPLVLALSRELEGAGAYKAVEVAGVPVLLTRGADGAVRAFVNMCSHRGSMIMPEGTGTARRFTCPYHAWSYNTDGDLVGVLDADDFGDIDRSCLGLTPLPVAERAGLVWVTLDPAHKLAAPLGLDAFLCGYDSVLADLGLADCHVVGQQTIEGPNWKVAYDGYLDFYHLPILHKSTFGENTSSKALYHAWGPHQRVSSPGRNFGAYIGTPLDQWPQEVLANGVWTIFPHVSIASFEAAGKMMMVSQLYPGASVGESITVQTFVHLREPDDEVMAAVKEKMDFLLHVVRDEDYFTGKRLQRAMRTGAKEYSLFGRNEGGGQRFHSWVNDLLATDDAGLHDLFAAGARRPRFTGADAGAAADA